MPVRFSKSRASHSIEAASPRSSNIPGRNSVAMRRTVLIIVSICAVTALALRARVASLCTNRAVNHARSNFMAVNACPN
jgi:hypothetical protein